MKKKLELVTALRRLINLQAKDDGLWFVAETAPEAYLQEHLRELHYAVEKLLVEIGK